MIDKHPFTYDITELNIQRGEVSYQFKIKGSYFNATFYYKASDPVLRFDKGIVIPGSIVEYNNFYQIGNLKES